MGSLVATLGLFFTMSAGAQAPDPAAVSFQEATSIAHPLAEDRGDAALEQALRRIHTTASVLEIVAHPDDEDGALLTYLSRGLGARVTLFTMTRGEGGQNAMTSDTYDALGVMRTNELLRADQFYGIKQLWGTEADFGFSKTQEEAFSRWGHDRVLYDAVLAVRIARPQIIIATFVGAVCDGHGQHQVSGEIAQEAFKAASDPRVFPEQLKNGLTPWQPLAVYSMVPFAPISEKGMFDYATGKWAPAEFKNHITGEVIHGPLSADATMPVGSRDFELGRSYAQIAREGWGEQKSQNGGSNPALSGPATSNYHLWAVVPEAKAKPDATAGDLFHNQKVGLDTSIAGLARLDSRMPAAIRERFLKLNGEIEGLPIECSLDRRAALAHQLAGIYREVQELQQSIAKSGMDLQAIYSLDFELDSKAADLQLALRHLLGLDLVAFTTNSDSVQGGGPRGGSAEEMPASVAPGQDFRVRVHVSQSSPDVRLSKVELQSESGDTWQVEQTTKAPDPAAPAADVVFTVKAAENAAPTAPFFTRPNIEQPYYDDSDQSWRERSFAPWPLSAAAEFTFEGVPIRLSEVVQTLQRATGPGGWYQPLIVAPAIGVSVTPDARILPLDGTALPVTVTVHTQGAAEGAVSLKLPANWRSEPAELRFHRDAAGDAEPLQFAVRPDHDANPEALRTIAAVATSGGKTYTSGWRSVGYQGLRPYNVYRPAAMETRKVDVKLAPGLRVAYVMGPGDLVPDALEAMGISPHMLSAQELLSDNLSAWNVILVGIRAYSTRPELTTAQPRLDAFVRNGGTLVVQYQSATFPAPLKVTLGRIPERVVDENAPVKLISPNDPILSTPNRITPADFNDWVEERGHSFADSWDPALAAVTETADAGQDPQRGGLLVGSLGKGKYIYVSYALYRQLPELVPGAYRILANLLSAGQAVSTRP